MLVEMNMQIVEIDLTRPVYSSLVPISVCCIHAKRVFPLSSGNENQRTSADITSPSIGPTGIT